MSFDPNPVIEAVSVWAEKVSQRGEVGEVYLFGSLINVEGDAFYPQVSDVDVLCTFRDEDVGNAVSRYHKCKALSASAAELEAAVFSALKRKDASKPIASVNLLSSWEASKGIHKDGARRFFYLKQFARLRPRSTGLTNLQQFLDEEFQSLNDGPIRAFQNCQKVRNQYLKTTVHGERFISVSTGTDPLPKDIMRIAAALAAFEKNPDGSPDDLESVDPLEGLEFITKFLNNARVDSAEVEGLRRWVAIARGGRGTATPMTGDQLLLLSELAFDRAKKSVRRSPLDKIDSVITRSENR